MITAVSATTLTAVNAIAAMGLTAAFSIGVAAVLIFLLVTRELAMASGSGFAARLGRFVGIGIIPLSFIFGVVMILRIIQILA